MTLVHSFPTLHIVDDPCPPRPRQERAADLAPRTLAWRSDDVPRTRQVRHVSAGRITGYGTRLVTPDYLGRLLHPVVGLDLLDDAASESPACPDSSTLLLLCEQARGQPCSGIRLHLAHDVPLPTASYIPRRPGGPPADLVLGGHGADFTCLHLCLNDSESWYYSPPAGKAVWIAVASGGLLVADREIGCEIALFAASDAPIEVQAIGPVHAVIGCATGRPQ